MAHVHVECCQGVYPYGSINEMATEYPVDAPLVIGFLQSALKRKATWGTDAVYSISGSYTQPSHPKVSESESALLFLIEAGFPKDTAVALDEVALDSCENVKFGIMAARRFLNLNDRQNESIDNVTIYTAHKFKYARFALICESLGINRYKIVSGVEACDLGNSLGAVAGEIKVTAAMVDDPLMLSDEWECKRRDRFQGTEEEYMGRLDELRNSFPETFTALIGGKLDEIATAFRAEVLRQ